MTKSQNQTLTRGKEELLAEIMFLAAMTQYRTDRCVFVNFSGHVNRLEISIRESMDDYQTEIARREISLTPSAHLVTTSDLQRFEDDLLNSLQQTKNHLEKFIEKGEVKTEDFIKVVSYTF